MFIATVLRNSIEKTLWHRQNIKSSIRTQQITLPVDAAKNVNWNFMEKYIRSIPNSNLIKNKVLFDAKQKKNTNSPGVLST